MYALGTLCAEDSGLIQKCCVLVKIMKHFGAGVIKVMSILHTLACFMN